MAWYNPFSWGGTGNNTRRQGYQNEGPGVYPSESAAPVTFDSAMTVSAFWASVRLLTETVASMPLECYLSNSDGSRSKDKTYRIWRTLNYQPNKYQTKVEFFETLMLNLVTDGNAYVRVVRNTRGIVEFIPLMSAQMRVLLERNGSLIYQYTDANSKVKEYTDKQIWHVRLFGNGLVGMSPLEYARQQLGITLATEKRVGKIASNGGKVSGILTIDKVLGPEQRTVVRDNMKDIANGDTDTLKILEAGMGFQQIALSPQDMQMIENRHYNVEDIARFMGVPSVLINDTSAATTWGSGIQEINRGFYKLNLRPYLERIESSLKRHLMPVTDWDRYDLEFNFDSLLRASYEERVKAKATAINSGQLTPNEARNDEGLEDKDGGDQILVNGSLTPVGMAGQKNTQPEPALNQSEDEDDEENTA